MGISIGPKMQTSPDLETPSLPKISVLTVKDGHTMRLRATGDLLDALEAVEGCDNAQAAPLHLLHLI